MTDTLSRIRSRAYWEVAIRPTRFVREKIPNITRLFPIIQGTSVKMRGWPYPVVLNRPEPTIGDDFIEFECSQPPYLERWTFFQSGQFVDNAALHYDWLEEAPWHAVHEPRDPRAILGIGDVLFRFTEIFEFASRLAMSEAGDNSMVVSIALKGIRGKALWVDSAHRAPMLREYVAAIDEFSRSLELDRNDLVARPREQALQLVVELFRRFGWDPPLDLLRVQQAELRPP